MPAERVRRRRQQGGASNGQLLGGDQSEIRPRLPGWAAYQSSNRRTETWTAKQQQAWARVARGSHRRRAVPRRRQQREANGKLFESTVDAVFARVQPSDVAEAMHAGWLQATDNVAGYLQRQADLDYSQLHWRWLVDLQTSATTNRDYEER